ncbi:hypothetical protein [Tenacibaculum sp. 190524A05c]|uniref:hypothetical protein n=1 Tax=Tenacibaculum platacis TaxID=3137852 RepID=UPI0031FB1B12
MKNNILILILTIIFMSCSSKSFDDKEKLWEYLRDSENGYLHTKNVNGYDFSIVYKPTDLMVTQELGQEYTKEDVEKFRKKYKKYIYFTLSMSRDNKELLSSTPKNRQEFGAMVNNLAFGMGEKVHVYTTKKDTLELLDYVYPRMYGMSKSTDMLFVYPRDENYLQDEYLNITVGDLGTYTGEVKFKIPTQKIKNEPKINF